MIAESCEHAPLGPGLRAWAGEQHVVPARGATVLVVGPLGVADPRYRLVPGGLADAHLAVDSRPDRPGVPPDLPALAGVRLAQSEWLLDTTVERLRRRESAGRPLLAHNHLRLRVSQAAVHLAEAACAARTPGAAAHAHRAVSRADELLAELHGGSSVLTGSPGHLARFSALLALAFVGVM